MDWNENLTSFGGGFVISVLGNSHWIINLQVFTPHVETVMIEWTIKVFGTIILGIVGGLAGLFAKDLYKWIKHKITR